MFNPKFNMDDEKEQLRRKLPPVERDNYSLFSYAGLAIVIIAMILALLFLPSPV